MLAEPSAARMADAATKSKVEVPCESFTSVTVQCQDVQFSGNVFRFPVAENLVTYFEDAVEITVPSIFWTSLISQVDPKRFPPHLLNLRDRAAAPMDIRLPNGLFQWSDTGSWPKPPVRGPLVELKRMDNFIVWRTQASDIPADWLYITFENRSDIYVQCNDVTFGSPFHSCDLNWFDGSAIHMLGIPADWLRNAPAFVDAYRRAIRPK